VAVPTKGKRFDVPSDETSGERAAAGAQGRLTREEILEVVGDIDDARAAAIIATGATIEDLEEAVGWAAGESDVMGDLRLRASPVVGEVYDLLTAEEKLGDERG
jgi:hypothetical protein